MRYYVINGALFNDLKSDCYSFLLGFHVYDTNVLVRKRKTV